MNETIKSKYSPLLIFFLWTVFAMLPAPVNAESPWKWQMSLRIETPGDAMYMPSAVAFDPTSERYYVIDTGHNRLVSFGRDGQMLRAFSADDKLLAPFDMVRLDNGQLWVVEKGRNSLTLIDVGAKKVEPHTLMDGSQQVFPDRVAYGGGKLFVLDRASGQVLRLNAAQGVEQRFGCATCMDGFADFVLANDSVWALETLGKKLYRFLPDGTIAETIHLEGQVDFPVSLAVGPDDSFYILDRHQNRVVVFSRDGKFQYNFLEVGQGPGQLYFPRQLRFDPWGRLCVVDEGNGRVEVFSR
jgi:sugar lactone lactonase YvrE